MPDLATVQLQLTQARLAYHQLMTGVKAVQVRNAEGRFAVYAQASAPQLAMYISSLEQQEAILLGSTINSGTRRPIYVNYDAGSHYRCRRW